MTDKPPESFNVRRTIERLMRMHEELAMQLREESAARRVFEKNIEALRAELAQMASYIGEIPDPITGRQGSGIRGYIYQSSHGARQAMLSSPELSGVYSIEELVERVREAEKASKSTHTRMIGTLVGAVIGGIIAAVSAALSLLK